MAENTRNEEKPNDEDLRTKKPTTASNQARDTVRGNIEDVVACINKAREAQKIAAHDLEKASNWLNKSQELLAEALAAIATGDTYKETLSGNPDGDAVVDNDDTNVNGLNPDTNPEQARTPNNWKEAETHNILEAEQIKLEDKLFPAKPKNDEKPCDTPSYAGVTVEGNPEDVLACVDKAKKAFAEKDLEKAKKWLVKSQRMRYTVNVQELLDKVLAAIAARDALKETSNVNTNAGPDADNFIVDPNPEQDRTRTPAEPSSGPTVHNDDVGAKKCIDNANRALKAGDFDKAERLFIKAKRMDASIDVDQYLKLVHDGRVRDLASRENAYPEKGSRETERPEQAGIMDESKTYLQVAGNAFNDKNYERALIFLDKSEALHASERAVTLRIQVQDAMSEPKNGFVEKFTSYFTGEKPIKPSYKDELEKLITAIRNDIDAGNLDEAERKLLTPGFVKTVCLKKLRTEVSEKKALRIREDKPKTAESNPKPVEQVEPPRNSILSDIRAEEANTCINIAERAYYDGDLDKAERLLRKAERLYPTEQAKKALEKVYTAKEEKKRLETSESNEVQQFINSGLDDMEKQNYYSAELAFQRAKHLQPRSKYIDGLLTDVQAKINNRNAEVGTNTIFSTTESREGTSTRTQNRQNEKPTSEADPIAAANKYTGLAQDVYNFGDIENAESFLKLAEVYNSTERSRNLLVMILRAKHGVDFGQRDDDNVNKKYVVVNHSPNKKSYEKVIKEYGYLRSAEDAFINGDFKVADIYMTKLEVVRSPYVTELREKIKKSLTRNSRWYDKLQSF